eukprot:3070056-Amphidinium_carterae.2
MPSFKSWHGFSLHRLSDLLTALTARVTSLQALLPQGALVGSSTAVISLASVLDKPADEELEAGVASATMTQTCRLLLRACHCYVPQFTLRLSVLRVHAVFALLNLLSFAPMCMLHVLPSQLLVL